MMANQRPPLAVLIDAENARAADIAFVMEKINAWGNPIICRAYGDWTTSQLTPWKKVLEASGIRPCQQFRHARGKNATDGTLIMDAMDIKHARSVEGICIVSSDSDYTGLAGRLREAGLVVYGFGDKYTLNAFVNACDEFVFVDQVAISISR